MFKKPQQDAPSTNALALTHMEEKYGEPFTYAAPWGSSYTGTREFLASCQSLPGKTVLVQVEDFQGEAPVYRDNFLAVKYEEDTLDFFRAKAEELFGQVNVFYEASKFSLTGELPAEPSFETFFADEGTVMDVLVELKGSSDTSPDQLDALAAAFAECRGELTVTLVGTADADFGTLSRRELNLLAYRKEAEFCAAIRCRNGSTTIDLPEEE